MNEQKDSPLRKQAWDYFAIHAAQRITTFNFYLGLSFLVATAYFASFKTDSNLQTARPVLAALLCFFSFIFWKLDQRNRFLVKHAERALKHFEGLDLVDSDAMLFTQEEIETNSSRLKGWRRTLFWKWQLSYADCFNLVFAAFFILGLLGLVDCYWQHPNFSVLPLY